MTMANIPKQSAVMADEFGTGNSDEVTASATAFQAKTEGIPNLVTELASTFLGTSKRDKGLATLTGTSRR